MRLVGKNKRDKKMSKYGQANEEVKESGAGIFILPGEYEFEVHQAKWKDAEKSYKKSNSFILNLKVIESNVAARAPGVVCDYVAKDTKKDGTPNSRFWENVKKPLMPILGAKDYSEITSEVMALVCEKGAAVGKRVHCVATEITLDNGQPYTALTWSPSTSAK
jgi:hypothetical protein